jgi:hypothetical protein
VHITNPQVKEIHGRWQSVFDNPELKLDTRLKAFSIVQVIETMTVIYEMNETVDQEDIDDLFIAWNKDYQPILIEDKPKLLENLRKRQESFKSEK